MDYVDWCDSLAEGMAEYAEQQHGRWIHLHQFASHFTAARQLSAGLSVEYAAILDAVEVLATCGLDGRKQFFPLKRADLERLRDRYARWLYSQAIPLDDLSLHLLHTLNRLSQRAEEGYTTVIEVNLDAIVAEFNHGPEGVPIDGDLAMELLDGLEELGLAHSHKTLGLTQYKSSYLGIARTNRAFVAVDQEIDQLRTAGEGDTLDYKRNYRLGTDGEKWEFTKDVTALANAGGAGSRYLLLGVEDNGDFYRPASADEEGEHRALLAGITDTRLQQIVASRTTHSPSVRVVAQGKHRDGPYILLEITRDMGHLPYRIYRNQTDRKAHNAEQLGEVWVRKGTTKALATAVEIAALERQADLFRRTRTSRTA